MYRIKGEGELPNKLKEVREELNLTQKEMAFICGMPLVTYQRYESSKRVPDIYTGKRMAKAVGKTVEELFPEER